MKAQSYVLKELLMVKGAPRTGTMDKPNPRLKRYHKMTIEEVSENE